MKTCPNCNFASADDRLFCEKCGTKLDPVIAPPPPVQEAPQFYQSPSQQPPYQPVPPVAPPPMVDPYDHTAEFDAQDISDNKVIAVVVYLMGAIGVIIALLAAKDSKYVAFHLRQELKFIVVNVLLGIATALLSWTVIGAIAGGIMVIVLAVIEIICVFDVFKGKAKEAAIIRDLKFLK